MNTPICAKAETVPATILLIDSDQDRLATTARVLEADGYSVVTGSSAARANSLTRLYRPDLVLIDVEIPDRAALAVVGRIKLDPELASVFVVLISAERVRDHRHNSGERRSAGGPVAGTAPADGYLPRPCGRDDFLDRIEAFLRIRSAQESLRESEQRYRMLFLATQNGFALHQVIRDAQGLPCDCCFLEVNPAFEELTGLGAEAIIGRSVQEVIPGTGRDWTEAYGKVAHSGKTVQFEGYFGPRQRYYQVEVYAPQPGQLASIFTDVTDRKRLEESLQQAHKLSDEVQEISKLGGWKFDVRSGQFTWSDEVCRIYGVAQDFDLNDLQRAISFYAPEHQPIVRHAFEQAVQNGTPYDLQVRFIRANGESIWVRTVANPVLEGGQVVTVVGNIIEITERKQMEEALRASEERYRAIVDGFAGVIYICSQDYRISFMNEALIKRTGRNAVGEHCFKALHDLNEVCSWCVNERVFKGEVVKWEVQSPKDGRWYYAINSLVHNRDGTLSKQAMIHDITHLKQAEEQLKFKSFTLDNLAEEIIWLTSDCRILDVNPVACERLGYSREELLTLSAPDIDPNYPRDACSEHWEHLKRAGSVHFESVHQTRDGRIYPVEILANYLNHNGLEYNCSIVRDITERKNLEKALQESAELFRTLCDSAPIGIFRCDAEWENIYCNPRWEEITGISAAKGWGDGWLWAIHPDDREDLAKVLSAAAARGSGYSHEHRKLTPQGEAVWVRVLVSPIKGLDGRVVGHVGTLEDITEQRQARKEILKAQKLESIGVLAGGIAHDFNNILTAILGNISLARYQMQEPEKVAKRLEDAEKAAARAKDLTQQLLTFARGGEPVKKVIEVRGLLQEAAAFALHGSNLRCSFDLADDLWPVEADEGQLVQVAHNLVLNAVQATQHGGTVSIRAHNVGSRLAGEGFVAFSVSDNGAGISEQHLEKIFDPYFTTKDQGSGLGLASCYSIVKKHGGTLRAESTPGQGSSFHFMLPASKELQFPRLELESALLRGNSRVLVMDDEEIVRTLSKAILEQLGYPAVCVENGTRAVEVYQKAKEEGEPFDVVILDLTVPGGVGGKETMRMLLKIDPQVKAIVCSGYSTDPVMANHRAYGFSAVLSKPYRPHDLSKVLQELLAGSGEQAAS